MLDTPPRERLPITREGLTHKFVITSSEDGKLRQLEGYITANVYEDGRLAEVFCTVDKEGSTIGGLIDGIATLMSVSLQYGVPLHKILEKMVFTRFEPSGRTSNKEIVLATSILDYLAKWLSQNFLPPDEQVVHSIPGDICEHSSD